MPPSWDVALLLESPNLLGNGSNSILTPGPHQRTALQDLEYWYRPSCYASIRQELGSSPARPRVTTRSMAHGGGVHVRGDSSSSLNDSPAEVAGKPLVFVHGVGFGVVSFFGFVSIPKP